MAFAQLCAGHLQLISAQRPYAYRVHTNTSYLPQSATRDCAQQIQGVNQYDSHFVLENNFLLYCAQRFDNNVQHAGLEFMKETN